MFDKPRTDFLKILRPTVPYKRDDFVTAVIGKCVETDTDGFYKSQSGLLFILPDGWQLISVSKMMRPPRWIMALSHLSACLYPRFKCLRFEVDAMRMAIWFYCPYEFFHVFCNYELVEVLCDITFQQVFCFIHENGDNGICMIITDITAQSHKLWNLGETGITHLSD